MKTTMLAPRETGQSIRRYFEMRKVAEVTKETDDGFHYVEHEQAMKLLGEERFERLLNDPIRRLGPEEKTVYPWNVVDYLMQPNLGKQVKG